jgi:hypothetical protein
MIKAGLTALAKLNLLEAIVRIVKLNPPKKFATELIFAIITTVFKSREEMYKKSPV